MNQFLANQIFDKLTSQAEKKELLDILVQQPGSFILKINGAKGRLTAVKPIGRLKNKKLFIQVLLRPLLIQKPVEAIFYANIGDKKVIGQVLLHMVSKDLYAIEFNGDLYRVQRREHFRLIIPDSYSSELETLDLKKHFKIADISVGGCRLRDNPVKFEKPECQLLIEQKFKATISIKGFSVFSVNGQVRAIIKRKNYIEYGISFLGDEPEFKKSMSILTLDLYRKLYRSE